MDVLTIGLTLSAGLLHAIWHSLVKSGNNGITVLAGMGTVAGLCASAALPFVRFPTSQVWTILALSIGLHIAYKLCLAGAYVRGDFGQAFPLARGTVPLFAMLIALVSLGQMPSIQQWVGITLASLGLVLFAIDKLKTRSPWPLLLTAGAAGAAVASYSVVDSYGTRLSGDWLAFTAWLVVLDSLAFLAVSRLLRGPGLWIELKTTRWRAAISGLLGLLSFSVFLWALSRNPVSAVIPIRETSVLFAVTIGVFLQGETLSLKRLSGAIAILAALLVIAP